MSKVVVKVNANIDTLRNIRDNLHSKTQRLLVNTIREADWEASELVLQAKSYNDGNDDVHLMEVEDDLKVTLTMTGADALFVEFGAGDLTLYPFYPGEYSEKNKQQYSKKGRWYYNGVRYTGIPAYRPMFTATQTAWRFIEEHANEVFGE